MNFGLSGEEINTIFNNKNELTYKNYIQLIADIISPGGNIVEAFQATPTETTNETTNETPPTEGIFKYSPNTIATFMYMWLGKGKTLINREDFKSSVIDAIPYEHVDKALQLIPEDNFLEFFDLLNEDNNDMLTVNEFKNTKVHKDTLKEIANKYITIFLGLPDIITDRILQGGLIGILVNNFWNKTNIIWHWLHNSWVHPIATSQSR